MFFKVWFDDVGAEHKSLQEKITKHLIFCEENSKINVKKRELIPKLRKAGRTCQNQQ